MRNIAIDYRECLLSLDPPRRRWRLWKRLGRTFGRRRAWLAALASIVPAAAVALRLAGA